MLGSQKLSFITTKFTVLDLDAAEALAAGAMLADSGVQEGAYGNVEQSGELLGGEAVCGFAD